MVDNVSGSISAETAIQNAINWAVAIANNNNYTYGKGGKSKNLSWFQCPICYGCTKKSDLKFTCMPFLAAAYAHGTGDPVLMKNKTHKMWLTDQNFQGAYSKVWMKIGRCKDLTMANLKPGDVVIKWSSDNSHGHAWMYGGGDSIVEAVPSGIRVLLKGAAKKLKSYGTKEGNSVSRNYVMRYIGAGRNPSDVPIPTGGKTEGNSNTTSTSTDNGAGVNLQQTISKLYSSDNYEYITSFEEDEENNRTQELKTRFKREIQEALNKLDFNSTESSGAIPEAIVNKAVDISNFEKDKPSKILKGISTNLLSFPTLVEAPTIILDFNGIKIGGYNNKGDKYPNYITSMTANKINGKINTYTINLSYQVRYGEDPNFIDKLISRTGYLNPLKILYGDSNYNGSYYKEESAIITDVRHSEDVSSYRINYVITAVSSIVSAQVIKTTYESKTTKPSTAIYDLLYNSGEISKSLQELFPGMRNKLSVSVKGLIPTTDSVVEIGGMENVSPLTYLSHLVACMKNPSKKSTYYLSLVDNSLDRSGGSYFKINEIENYGNNVSDINSSYFELDIGYPSDNFVMSFQLCNNDYWSLVYKYAGDIPKYNYNIDNKGNLVRTESNILYRDNKYIEGSILNSNWWTQVTEFPVSAKVKIKGLLSPAMLMSYIKINALFYGYRDMASGLYVVTAQNDSISGDGYSTELTLLRVAGE